MTDWKAIQRRHDREDMKAFAISFLSLLFGGLIFTMPIWMILLGII